MQEVEWIKGGEGSVAERFGGHLRDEEDGGMFRRVWWAGDAKAMAEATDEAQHVYAFLSSVANRKCGMSELKAKKMSVTGSASLLTKTIVAGPVSGSVSTTI